MLLNSILRIIFIFYHFTNDKPHNKAVQVFDYSPASLSDGDTFWEIRRQAVLSLCECHRLYLHKPR